MFSMMTLNPNIVGLVPYVRSCKLEHLSICLPRIADRECAIKRCA